MGADNPATGGPGRGDTKMKQLRTLLARALILAVLLVALSSQVARADPGDPALDGVTTPAPNVIPEDPGIPPDLLPQDPGIE